MPEKTAKEIILKDRDWANCWICEKVFRRRRQTARYCASCEQAFCEGEHGNFAQGRGQCVVCGLPKEALERLQLQRV